MTATERSDQLHGRRLAKAEESGNPAAVLIAWTDRIRAAKDPALARKAAAALALLYQRHTDSHPVNSPRRNTP